MVVAIMKKKLSDSQLAAKLKFIEEHGAKQSFFKKYLDNSLFYIAMNLAFWVGLMLLIERCSK
jgi:hypothetical protein